MDNRCRINQNELKYICDTAKERMDANNEYADKCKDIIAKQRFFSTEKEALLFAIDKMRKEPCNYQIWAKIEKVDDVLRIQDYWLVTDDWRVKQAADYIGMAQMYDETRLSRILNDNIKIDDVI